MLKTFWPDIVAPSQTFNKNDLFRYIDFKERVSGSIAMISTLSICSLKQGNESLHPLPCGCGGLWGGGLIGSPSYLPTSMWMSMKYMETLLINFQKSNLVLFCLGCNFFHISGFRGSWWTSLLYCRPMGDISKETIAGTGGVAAPGPQTRGCTLTTYRLGFIPDVSTLGG